MLNVAGFCRSASDGGRLGREQVDAAAESGAAYVAEVDKKPVCSVAGVVAASNDETDAPSVLSDKLPSAFDADSELPASEAAAAAASDCCLCGRTFIFDTLD